MEQLVQGQRLARHARAPDELLAGGRPVVGSVRDPWDWYVSLWAFGCGRKGNLYSKLTRRRPPPFGTMVRNPRQAFSDIAAEIRKPTRAWARAYSDRERPELFREWLHMLLDPRRRADLPEGFGRSSLADFAGFYSYRYAYLFSRTVAPLYGGAIRDIDALREHDRRNNLLGHTIRNEQLEEDFIHVLRACGVELSDESTQQIRSAGRTNASSRRKNIGFYYDPQTADLVATRDALIIEKYGYTPPSLPR
jgi:hypothetical protein